MNAVEGSQVMWICQLNKAVEEAVLVDNEGNEVPLAAEPTRPQTYRAALELQIDQRWKLRLKGQGRS